MITEEEIAEALSRYQKYLEGISVSVEAEAEQAPLESEEDRSGLSDELGTDLGIEAESGKSKETLLKGLGLTGEVLPLMFKARHRLPYLLWTVDLSEPQARQKQQRIEEEINLPVDWEPLRLKYHQLAGVHSIFRRLVASGDKIIREGILIADEVGVGKTAQALACIALMAHLFSCQEKQIAPGGMFGKFI